MTFRADQKPAMRRPVPRRGTTAAKDAARGQVTRAHPAVFETPFPASNGAGGAQSGHLLVAQRKQFAQHRLGMFAEQRRMLTIIHGRFR